MVGAALLVLGLALVVLASTATTRLLSPAGRIDTAVTFAVVATAGTSTAVLLVGLPGLLSRVPLLIALAVWAAVTSALLVRRHGPEALRPGSLGLSVEPAAARRHPWVTLLVTVATLAVAWEAFVALVLPPYAFDALTYHLTTVATWVQQHDLAPPKLSLCCGYYPDGAELPVTWPAVLLGSDTVAGLTQVCFAVLGAVATAGIARSVGISRAGAAGAGALFVLTPVVLAQAPTNYVDVTQVALALAGLDSCLRFARSQARGHAVVTGLAAGLLLGTKGTGGLWALALLLALGVTAWRDALGVTAWRDAHRRSERLRRAAAAPGLAAGLCVALGCWWYVRNAVEHGNPLYPFRVQLFGSTLLNGPIDPDAVLTRPDAAAGSAWPVSTLRSWAGDLDFWHQGAYDYQQRLGGLGPLWVWLGLPLLVVMTIVLVRRRSPGLLAVIVVAAIFVVQPYPWWSRFTMALAALGAVAVAFAVEAAPRRWLRLAVAALAGLLTLGGAAYELHVVDPAGGANALAARSVLSLAGKPAADRTVGKIFFPEYAFLDRVPAHAVVVVDLGARPVRFVYPLFGSSFTRTVLPGGTSAPAADWIVTARGRPLDRAAAADHVLASDIAGVRAWRPRGPG